MSELLALIIPAKIRCPHCGDPHVDKPENGEAQTTHLCEECGKYFDIYVKGVSA